MLQKLPRTRANFPHTKPPHAPRASLQFFIPTTLNYRLACKTPHGAFTKLVLPAHNHSTPSQPYECNHVFEIAASMLFDSLPCYSAVSRDISIVKRQPMGVDCRVEDEDGGVLNGLPDSQSLVAFLLTTDHSAMGETVCLRFIDEYGDTTFNQLQIPVLLQELRGAVLRCTNLEVRAHGEKLAALVATAEGEMHTYVKFIGD